MDAGRAGGYAPNQIPSFSTANEEFFEYVTQHWPRWQAGQRFPCEIQNEIWGNVFDWAGWPVEPAWESTRIFSKQLPDTILTLLGTKEFHLWPISQRHYQTKVFKQAITLLWSDSPSI